MRTIKNNRILLIAAACAGLLLLGIFLAVASTRQEKAADTTPQQTAADTTTSASTNYSGFESLINISVTADQVDGLKYALYQYTQSNNQEPKEVAVITSTVVQAPYDPATDSKFTVRFDVRLDQEVYQATMDYFDITAMRLYLRKPGSEAIIYDSRTIDIYQLRKEQNTLGPI